MARRDFKVFQPKRPRELMPIIGTGTGRRNELNFDDRSYQNSYQNSNRRPVHVYHHDVEAERERADARTRKNDAIVAEIMRFWFVYPYQIILKSIGRYSDFGIMHFLSIIFWIAILDHAINHYTNPTNILTFFWICLIIFASAIVAMLKILKEGY